jgi:mannose-1-phosphate guanylyltransferase/mannose-6-phosphate isomerase
MEIDGMVEQVGPGNSVFIPKGAVHRLANSTEEPVHLVEVQTGDYFGEDDIVRLDDIYGRSDPRGQKAG